MTLPRLSAAQPITAPSGRPTAYLLGWMAELVAAVNGVTAAMAAGIPANRSVVAAGGLQGGGALESDVGLSLYRVVAPVSQLPSTGNTPGDWAYAVDGRKPGEAPGAGTGLPVFWSHSAWFSISGVQVVA